VGGAHQESDPGPVPPLITPPTRVRYTPAVQAEIEEQERAAVQRSTVHLILSELLGLGAHLTVGRPSNSVKRRIAIRNTLESLFCSTANPRDPLSTDSVKTWLASDLVRKACVEKGWEEEHGAMCSGTLPASTGRSGSAVGAGAGPTAGDGSEDALDPASERRLNDIMENKGDGKHAYRNYRVRLVLRSWFHLWAKDGSHCGWRDVNDWQEQVDTFLGHRVPRATAYRYRKREMDLFARKPGVWTRLGEQAVTSKPDVVSLMAEIDRDKEKQAVKAAMGDGSAEPDLAPNPRIKFLSSWYAELEAAARELSSVVGFGPTIVQSLAADIYMAHMGLTEDQLDWMPSKRWVYWFMHQIMGLSVRRVTGHAVSEADLTRQNELHDLNLQALAIELSDVDGRPLDPKYIMGADEFGMHFFPHGKLFHPAPFSRYSCACSAYRGVAALDVQLLALHVHVTSRRLHVGAQGGQACADQLEGGQTAVHW
jgi:hypothetical protein